MIKPEQIIYLDNNATTALDPAVVEEMLPYLTTWYGNPSAGYGFGAQMRAAIERAREQVAALLGCSASDIMFTSGGTESIHSALASALQLDPRRQHVVTTAVEHSATRRHCQHLAERGLPVTEIGVDASGRLCLDELARALRPDTALLTALWANNETGVLFPVAEMAQLAREARVPFHCDSVQAIGKIPVHLADSGIHFASVSAHKLHGPKGVGALYVHPHSPFQPSHLGGSQENNRRAGTENVASVVGFGKAAELALAALPSQESRVHVLRDRLEAALLHRIPGTNVNGAPADRLPNTASLSFPGIDSSALLLLLDRAGLCCSAGSACRTGSLEPSHVLRAMGLSEERMRGSVRFSLSRFTTEGEIDRAIDIIPRAIAKLRAMTL
ncbi:MAG: aminotransferase class V-fold PLP-dependent enzyme [Chthoniobacterales bacterium]